MCFHNFCVALFFYSRRGSSMVQCSETVTLGSSPVTGIVYFSSQIIPVIPLSNVSCHMGIGKQNNSLILVYPQGPLLPTQTTFFTSICQFIQLGLEARRAGANFYRAAQQKISNNKHTTRQRPKCTCFACKFS